MPIIFVEMSLMNEVNNFASVNFGQYGKTKYVVLDLWIFLGSKAKCLGFPQCPQITDMQLLTSNYCPPHPVKEKIWQSRNEN